MALAFGAYCDSLRSGYTGRRDWWTVPQHIHPDRGLLRRGPRQQPPIAMSRPSRRFWGRSLAANIRSRLVPKDHCRNGIGPSLIRPSPAGTAWD